MSLRDLCNSPSGAGGGLDRNPARAGCYSYATLYFLHLQVITTAYLYGAASQPHTPFHCGLCPRLSEHLNYVQSGGNYEVLFHMLWWQEKEEQRVVMLYIHFGKRLARWEPGQRLGKGKSHYEWKHLYLDHYFTQSLFHMERHDSLQKD